MFQEYNVTPGALLFMSMNVVHGRSSLQSSTTDAAELLEHQ